MGLCTLNSIWPLGHVSGRVLLSCTYQRTCKQYTPVSFPLKATLICRADEWSKKSAVQTGKNAEVQGSPILSDSTDRLLGYFNYGYPSGVTAKWSREPSECPSEVFKTWLIGKSRSLVRSEE